MKLKRELILEKVRGERKRGGGGGERCDRARLKLFESFNRLPNNSFLLCQTVVAVSCAVVGKFYFKNKIQ